MTVVFFFLNIKSVFYLDEVVQATVREEKKLMVENAKLKKEIEELKRQLLEKERRRGGKRTCNPKAEGKPFISRWNSC